VRQGARATTGACALQCVTCVTRRSCALHPATGRSRCASSTATLPSSPPKKRRGVAAEPPAPGAEQSQWRRSSSRGGSSACLSLQGGSRRGEASRSAATPREGSGGAPEGKTPPHHKASPAFLQQGKRGVAVDACVRACVRGAARKISRRYLSRYIVGCSILMISLLVTPCNIIAPPYISIYSRRARPVLCVLRGWAYPAQFRGRQRRRSTMSQKLTKASCARLPHGRGPGLRHPAHPPQLYSLFNCAARRPASTQVIQVQGTAARPPQGRHRS
jgi:hypothetical protein